MAQPRFRTVLLGGFATFAIVLATVGVFGLLSYLRDAKNAGDRHPRGAGSAAGRHGVEIVTHGLKLVASGIAIGIAAAIPLARVMRSMLLGVAPTDMPTFAAATAVLAAVAAAASYISARRQRASTRSQRCGPSELGRSLRSLRALR